MLVDEPLLEGEPDPILSIIATMNGNEAHTRKLATGIYQIGHFGSSHFLREGYIDRYRIYRLSGAELFAALERHKLSIGEYGVCDNVQQILDQCPELQDPNRQFVITVTPVVRAKQPRFDGWRWHKWGDYIGTHEPQAEYLYDERGIDGVLVYQIYEKGPRDGHPAPPDPGAEPDGLVLDVS